MLGQQLSGPLTPDPKPSTPNPNSPTPIPLTPTPLPHYTRFASNRPGVKSFLCQIVFASSRSRQVGSHQIVLLCTQHLSTSR